MSDFSYETPDEVMFLRAVVISLKQKGHVDIASFLEKCTCDITTSNHASGKRWNALWTAVNFAVPMDIFEKGMSHITQETKETIRTVCDEIIPKKNGLDVMAIIFTPSLESVSPTSRAIPSSSDLSSEPKPSIAPLENQYDVFVCHASEDKKSCVRELAHSLRTKGLKVWYDEFELKLGDSLRRKIDQGLANSRYGVVVLSESFFRKKWPQDELDGLAARERNGVKVILPIWHNITKDRVAQFSPMLAGLKAASTEEGIDVVVEEILRVVRPNQESIEPPKGANLDPKFSHVSARLFYPSSYSWEKEERNPKKYIPRLKLVLVKDLKKAYWIGEYVRHLVLEDKIEWITDDEQDLEEWCKKEGYTLFRREADQNDLLEPYFEARIVDKKRTFKQGESVLFKTHYRGRLVQGFFDNLIVCPVGKSFSDGRNRTWSWPVETKL